MGNNNIEYCFYYNITECLLFSKKCNSCCLRIPECYKAHWNAGMSAKGFRFKKNHLEIICHNDKVVIIKGGKLRKRKMVEMYETDKLILVKMCKDCGLSQPAMLQKLIKYGRTKILELFKLED